MVYSIAPASVEPLHHARHRRRLLADRDVDADDALALLVQDRVDRHRRLAGATVADDQLALAATDRDQRVDRLDPRLHRLLHRLPQHDARRHDVDLAAALDAIGTLAVDRLAERVHHATDEAGPTGMSSTRPVRRTWSPFLERGPVAEHHGADVVFLEVQRHPRHHLAGLAFEVISSISLDIACESP
jgi:hypothetical protein